jgi:hypothetical protein
VAQKMKTDNIGFIEFIEASERRYAATRGANHTDSGRGQTWRKATFQNHHLQTLTRKRELPRSQTMSRLAPPL